MQVIHRYFLCKVHIIPLGPKAQYFIHPSIHLTPMPLSSIEITPLVSLVNVIQTFRIHLYAHVDNLAMSCVYLFLQKKMGP